MLNKIRVLFLQYIIERVDIMANSLTTNKTCSASSFVMPYAPSRAVDGANINYDLTSRWVTNTNNTGSYMIVDLGALYKISNWSVTCLGITALQWPGGNALYNLQDFDLQIPTDNTLKTWANVDSVVGNSASSIIRNCTATVTRYVRLNIRANKGNHFSNYNPCTSVVSFDVFGIPVTSNANLSNLTASSGALVPTFASATKDYTVNVGYSVTTTTVTPTVQDAGATITVNNVAVVSGQASQVINLNVGSNVITTVVTASDGVTKCTYTVNVIRSVPPYLTNIDAAVADGTAIALTPSPFDKNKFSYAGSVDYTVQSITLTPWTDAGMTIKYNGATVNSGQAVTINNLVLGDNAIVLTACAADGSSQNYTVTITRNHSTYLYGLTSSVGSVTPSVTKTVFTYTVRTGSAGSTKITPIVEDPSDATIITLQVGTNTYTLQNNTPSPVDIAVGTTATLTISSTARVSPNTYTIIVKKY